MPDIPTVQILARFDRLVQEMNLKMGDGCPLKQEADMIRESYDDKESLRYEEREAKWQPRLENLYLARVALEWFAEATETLKALPGIRLILKRVLAGSITQDFEPSRAKDALYELELAATLKLAGFQVELREPDIVASGNGLNKPLAIACKYPSSRQQLHAHISKGYQQIAGQDLDGAVAIGLDLIIAKETGLKGWLDFRLSNEPPLDILERRLALAITDLETERQRDYPSERQLDGLIMTMTIAGFYGEPVGIAFLETIYLGCRKGNPLADDLTVVVQGIKAIRGSG